MALRMPVFRICSRVSAGSASPRRAIMVSRLSFTLASLLTPRSVWEWPLEADSGNTSVWVQFRTARCSSGENLTSAASRRAILQPMPDHNRRRNQRCWRISSATSAPGSDQFSCAAVRNRPIGDEREGEPAGVAQCAIGAGPKHAPGMRNHP